MFRGTFNANIWGNIRGNLRGGYTQRISPDSLTISADPATTLAAGTPVSNDAAIQGPGMRREAWIAFARAATVLALALAASFGAGGGPDGFAAFFASVFLLITGVWLGRLAIRALRLLNSGPWERWPAAVIIVGVYSYNQTSANGRFPVLMLFDFATGARHMLCVASYSGAEELLGLQGEIWFRGDPERAGVICVPGESKYRSAVRQLPLAKRTGSARRRFDTQWPPGNPAEWPKPHTLYKRDWPGAPQGYLSDPWND